MANLRLFTSLWGSEAIDTFKQGALKSYLWPKNKAAIDGNVWDVWSTNEHMDEIERLLFNSFDIKFEPHLIPDIKDQLGNIAPAPYVLHKPILDEMVLCLNSASKLLMLPPDTIFGDGSISNILRTGEAPGTCVVVPHVRVLPHLLNYIEDKALDNYALAGLVMETMHKSWINAEKGSPETNSFWSGVSWEKLDTGLISITHRIPTIYLASFTGQDHAAWQNYATFGAWDHRLPGETMVRQERLRMPGSSDVAMIAEITGPGDNIPPKTPPEVLAQQGPDGFWTDTGHSAHFRQSQFILRFKDEPYIERLAAP